LSISGPWVLALPLKVLPLLALLMFAIRSPVASARCRGCGGRRPALYFSGQSHRYRMGETILCHQCRGWIERVQESGLAAAVFIFRYGKRVRYYVGWQPPLDTNDVSNHGLVQEAHSPGVSIDSHAIDG
jgi:hypothetical protein